MCLINILICYSTAITTDDCSFVVEFHLPSGGDTNFIDKQFVVRLTDSRKTMKIILVSPRRIPEFDIPDFDDDFDLTKLEVLIPFGGATGGMIIVLIAILIYGYKTRPKDTYHRDRDNALHFRHVLFVVWFVGMRLLKSFLLTLTVFFVILTAIHYTNVRTLQEYETFHKQRKNLEEDFVKQMDTHKIQEINRQWSLLGEGKLICNQKLKALNVFLEKYFKEMKERQEEEMRKKYIILAAKNRIEKQFNETRAKFERERKRLNEQMAAYTQEINSRLSKIQGKIENNFWLKAAKGMYKTLKAIASFFGKSMKPFIRWVGLSVSFPSIHVDLPSFDSLFDEFTISALYPKNSRSNSSSWEDNFNIDTRISIQEIPVPELNISSPLSKERAQELLALEWIVQLYKSGVFATILLVLDILWFVYRHSKTYQLAIVLIHGFPKIYELEKIQEKEEKKEKKKKKKGEKLEKKAAKKAEKEEDEGKTINSSVDNVELQERSNKEQDKINTKSVAVGKATEGTAEQEKNAKTTEKGKGKVQAETDGFESPASATNCDKEIKPKAAKGKKVIRHGLKAFDRLNTVFVKFLVKLKELNYQVRVCVYTGPVFQFVHACVAACTTLSARR